MTGSILLKATQPWCPLSLFENTRRHTERAKMQPNACATEVYDVDLDWSDAIIWQLVVQCKPC